MLRGFCVSTASLGTASISILSTLGAVGGYLADAADRMTEEADTIVIVRFPAVIDLSSANVETPQSRVVVRRWRGAGISDSRRWISSWQQ